MTTREPAVAAPSWVWTSPFSLLVGGFVLSLFAFLAAVYLTLEASDDPELAGDFRRRALVSGVVVGIFALSSAFGARVYAPDFFARWLGSWWSWPLQIVTGVLAIGTFFALWRARYRLARALAIVQVAMVVFGWGAGQYPFLIPPTLTLRSAAAPPVTLRLLVPALILGGLLLLPSLYLLLRIFKSTRPPEHGSSQS